MSAGGMSRAEAVVLVQRIMDAEYASDDEVDGWLARLDRALSCPSGHVSDLIFWSPEQELSADEVVDRALAYRPVVL
ncbi:e9imm peptide [Streptomyces rubrogriseus]